MARRARILRWLIVLAAGLLVGLAATATPPAARIVARASIALAGWVVLLVFSYSLWPTRRVPRRLYHRHVDVGPPMPSSPPSTATAWPRRCSEPAAAGTPGGSCRHVARLGRASTSSPAARAGSAPGTTTRNRHEVCFEVLGLDPARGRVYRRPFTYVVAIDADVTAIVRRSPGVT